MKTLTPSFICYMVTFQKRGLITSMERAIENANHKHCSGVIRTRDRMKEELFEFEKSTNLWGGGPMREQMISYSWKSLIICDVFFWECLVRVSCFNSKP